MYQYNQTIDITSLNFYYLGMVEIQIRNKQYFVITEIVITRVYCSYSPDIPDNSADFYTSYPLVLDHGTRSVTV
jgi:hypothetical protein